SARGGEGAVGALSAAKRSSGGLFDTVVEGVYRGPADGRLVTANPALLKMLGYDSAEELVRVDIGRMLYADAEERKARIAQLDREGELRDSELLLRRRDGRLLTVLENARVMRN